jgi:hypothetical protein
MSLHEINWRAEALEFAKRADSNREVVIQLIEMAMQRGAIIAIAETTKILKEADTGLTKRRADSVPQHMIKPIEL